MDASWPLVAGLLDVVLIDREAPYHDVDNRGLAMNLVKAVLSSPS